MTPPHQVQDTQFSGTSLKVDKPVFSSTKLVPEKCAEVKIRFSGCAVKCPGTSNFARSFTVLSGHVRRMCPSISQFVRSLLQNCTHNNVLAM